MPEIFASEDEEGSTTKPHLWIVGKREETLDKELEISQRNRRRGERGVDWFVDVEEYLRTAFRQRIFGATQLERDPCTFMLHFKEHDQRERYKYVYETLSRIEEGLPTEANGTLYKNGQLLQAFRTRIREVQFYRSEKEKPSKMYNKSTRALYRTTYIPGDFSPLDENYTEEEVTVRHANAQFVNARNTLEEVQYTLRHRVFDLCMLLPHTAITSRDLVLKELEETKEYAIVSRPEAQGYFSNPPEDPFERYHSLNTTSQSTFNGVY